MIYEFPTINHINDILPAIANFPEFVVADRGDYKVINYMVAKEDTFGTPHIGRKMVRHSTYYHELDHESIIRRECRGIIFDRNGNLISRRYHKFFNINERMETQEEYLIIDDEHEVLEKLDGSMVTPIVLDNKVYWGTKMGITDTVVPVVEYVKNNEEYVWFAKDCFEFGLTPIFEWCSRANRIVIDYPVPRLVLTAVRNTISGRYYSHKEMTTLAQPYNIEVVKKYDNTSSIIDYLITNSRGLAGSEGYVLRFNNGHMLKFKSEWYVRIHKSKELFVHPRHLAQLVLNESADDAKAIMLPSDRERLIRYESALILDLENITNQIIQTLNRFDRSNPNTRKEYAMLPKESRLGVLDGIVFKNWDRAGDFATVFTEVKTFIDRFTSANVKFDEMRVLLPNSFKEFDYDT
jgi:RNA ligase